MEIKFDKVSESEQDQNTSLPFPDKHPLKSWYLDPNLQV